MDVLWMINNTDIPKEIYKCKIFITELEKPKWDWKNSVRYILTKHNEHEMTYKAIRFLESNIIWLCEQ